eukprot:scaffold45029_cov30-Phaeocystis_antarctica.AAC.1
MAQIKRWRPCPMASRSNAYKQRFWCHDRPRSEKNGGFGYARGIFHEETMSVYTGAVGTEHAYSGTSCGSLPMEVGKSPTATPRRAELPVA